jgi:CBS domain-containing protein
VKVSDIMTAPAVTVREDSTLEQVARVMLDHRIGGVPVVGEDGRLRGIITESDFSARNRPVPFSMLELPNLFGHWLEPAIERIYQEARGMTAGEVMTKRVMTVREDDPVAEAIRRMCESRVHRLPVVRDGVVVGVVARQDLLRLMLAVGLPPESTFHPTA